MAGEVWEKQHYQGDQLRIAAAVRTFAILAWLLTSYWSAQTWHASYWLIQSGLDGSQYGYMSRSNQDSPDSCVPSLKRGLIEKKINTGAILLQA